MQIHSSFRAPPSPCTGVCKIQPASGWCDGCGRTLGEIADWPMLNGEEKRLLLAELAQRITIPVPAPESAIA